MSKKQWYKIVSILTALALILGTFSGLTMVTTAETGSTIDLQAIVDAADIEVSNITTDADIDAALEEIELPDGYIFGGVYEFYKVNAFNGAVERGSTYKGAPDEEILVEGENGYITVVTSLLDAADNETFYALTFVIEPEYEEYSFASMSNYIDDWVLEDGKWKWNRNYSVQKLVIPDEITALAVNWYNWQHPICIVFNKNLTTINQGAQLQSEVVSFHKDSQLKTVGNNAFYNAKYLKYIRLPDTVTKIGDEAFYNCRALTQLYLPEGLQTIGKNIFATKGSTAHGHSISEIIIPSTVTSLDDPSMLGANEECLVTVLTKEEMRNAETFYTSDYPDQGSNYTVRVWKDSSADNIFATADGKKLYIDDITIAEAIARSAKFVNKFKFDTFATLATVTAASETLVSDIEAAYWGVEAIDVALAGDWVLNGNKWLNTLVYSNDEYTIEMPLTALAEYDFTATAQEIPVNNDTTAESIVASLVELQNQGAIPAGFEMAVTDFGKVRAYNGAIESGSTEDVVLVEGEKGYIVATITLSANGETKAYNIKKVIEPQYEKYTFATISNSITDWTQQSNGKWQYTRGESVDKIVIPDEITALDTNWHNWNSPKCIVYNKNITSLGQCTYLSNTLVVSFHKDSKLTTVGNDAFGYAVNLKYIRLPDTVTRIGDKAFYKNTGLEQLYLPKNLEYIGKYIFWETKDTTGFHNLKEINIPASVTYIGECAFQGAGQDCVVNVWTKSNNLWNADVFYNVADATRGEKFTVRVWNTEGLAGTADKQYNVAEGKKQYLDDMSFAEIVARATLAADAVKGNIYETEAEINAATDSIFASITGSYGSLTKVTATWKNAQWTKLTVGWENAVVLTVGDKTDEIPVFVSSPFDLAAKVAEAGIVINNKTTKPTFLAELKEKGIVGDDVEVEADVYVKEAYTGIVERGSTYEGAPTEDLVLSEPTEGYYAISVKVTSPVGVTGVGTISGKIEPEIKYYSFASVSKDSDWTIDETGDITGYSGTAEKVVVPDAALTNKVYALNSKITGKVLVMGKNMTKWRAAHYVKVEAIVFPEDCKIEQFTNEAFYGSSTLKYIKMPDTVIHIGGSAFKNCPGIEQFYISQNLKTTYENIFADPGKAHNVRRIEIPASNTSLHGMAFIGGDQYCEITVLSTATYENADVFYDGTNGKNNVIKVFSSASAASKFNTAAGNKVYLDKMGAADAAGRVLEKADSLVGQYTETSATIVERAEDIKTILTNAYYNATTISAEWANAEWVQEGFNLVNTLIVTDGEAKFAIEIKVDTNSGYYVGNATILTSDEFIKNNSKQGLRVHFFYDSSAADKIEIAGEEYTIKEYGVVMKHIADTYAGATAIADDAFVKGAEGVHTEIGDINTVITHTENGVNEYTALIKNIPQGGKDYAFQYRGFITYVNAGGEEVTVYTESDYDSVQNIFNVVGSGSAYSSMTDWFTGAALS